MREKLLRKYITVYFVVFCFLSILLVPGYMILRTAMINSRMETHTAFLSDGVRRLEDKLQGVQAASRKVYDASQVQTLSRSDKNITPAGAYSVMKARELFTAVTAAVSDSLEYGMVLKNRTVFLNDSYFTDVTAVSGTFFNSDNAGSLENWVNSQRFGNTPYRLDYDKIYTIKGGTRDALIFAEQLPINTKWNNTIFFSIIDKDELLKMLAVGDAVDHCTITLGQASGFERVIHGEASGKCLSIEASSSLYQLSVRLEIEYAYMMRHLKSYTDFILLCFAAYIIAGASLLAYAAHKNIKPLTKVLDGAGSIYAEINGHDSERGHDIVEYVDRFVEFIHDKLAENQELLSVRKNELLSNMFELLLRNRLYNNDPIAEELLNKMPDEWCMVLYQLGSADELTPAGLSEIQLLLQSIITKEPKIVLYHFSDNELILILSATCEYIDISERIHNELLTFDRQSELKCIIGLPRRGEDIGSVYKHLHTLLRLNGAGYTLEKESCIGTASQLSPDFGRSLFEHILNGKPEAAEQMLRDQGELLTAASASEDDIAEFFFACRCAINSIAAEMGISIPPLNNDNMETLSECTKRLIRYVRYISDSSKGKRLANATEQERAIFDRINELLTDCNLSSDMICGEFGISSSSLQRLMHKLCGQTFLSYVESKRLQNAQTLIQDTSIPIKEIAAKVGYASFNTFYKAFKKLFGMSPGSIRNDGCPEK